MLFVWLPFWLSGTLTVPNGEQAKLVVFFSAGSACYGGTFLVHCHVRITVDGQELIPSGASGAYFDENGYMQIQGKNDYVVKSIANSRIQTIVRYSNNISAGVHTFAVQYATGDSLATLRLSNWTLVVQRIKVS